MRHRRRVPDRPDMGDLARYAYDLSQARRAVTAEIQRGNVDVVELAEWMFGVDGLGLPTRAAA